MKIIGKGAVCKEEKKDRSKCRKWRLVVKTSQGTVKERFAGTYTQACDRRDALIEELKAAKSTETFSEYAEKWVSLREKDPDITKPTTDKNRTQIRTLERQFRDAVIADLTPSGIQEGLLAIREADGLSGTYMNQVFTLMKQILSSAEADGVIDRNPMQHLKAPKKDTKERHALSRERLVEFLDALDSLPMDAHIVAVQVAVLAGLRRGEVCALQWGDVEGGVIRVRRALQTRGMKLKTPKTASGIRDVPMVARLEKTLVSWKAIQYAQLAAVKVEQTDETPVCASLKGTMMHPENLNRWWQKNRKKFGMDGVVIHELRHTFLTLLAAGGASAFALRDLAGWSDLSMTSIYVHPSDDANRQAISGLEGFMGASDIPESIPVDIPEDA